ncbi:radical SAM protein, partial [bacterium]|nr:radical SAM protein [bacterium]
YWAKCSFCDECRESFRMDKKSDFLARFTQMANSDQQVLLHLTDHAIPPTILSVLTKSHISAPWYGFVRATPDLVQAEYTNKLADSGCRMLQIGFETPVNSLLTHMNKGVDPSHFPAIIGNLRNSGIKSYAYLLFGYPGQTKEHCDKTIEFLETSPPDFINAAIFRMPPGAPLSKFMIAGKTRDPDRLYLDFESDEMPMKRLRQWMSRCFYTSVIIRKMAQKTPRYYKSSHAVFI